MNSTAVGDRFEREVFEAFEQMIVSNRFPVRRQSCEIFTKKGYYSNDRKKNIIFDVSIEVYNPGSREISLLFLIECKNYTHSVPVDDSEEFFAKMQQVSAAKGIIVARGPFQEGTVNFCRSKRIGLLRFFTSSNVQFVLHRSSSVFGMRAGQAGTDATSLWQTLRSDERRSRFDFCGAYQGEPTNSLPSFFNEMLRDDLEIVSYSRIANRTPPPPCDVTYYSAEAIERKVAAILNGVKYTGGAVPLDGICRRQESVTGLKVHQGVTGHEGLPVLGALSFEPLEITIFADLEGNNARQRFTLAHELGHYFLGHRRYMRSEWAFERDLEYGATQGDAEEIRRMEWQANQFASSLLLPLKPLIDDFWWLARKHGLEQRSFGFLYVDEQKCNLSVFYDITNILMERYSVSRTAVKMRLERLKLITDGRKEPVRIGSVISSALRNSLTQRSESTGRKWNL